MTAMDAIVLRDVSKAFRKTHGRRPVTTLKSELVNLVLRRKRRALMADRIQALSGVTLNVPRGKTVGLVGRNGSGKSTLLKLITGIYQPTSGTVEVAGRISALLELGAGFHPDFTGRENILINGIILGMTRAQIRARIDDIIAFSELGDFIDEPVRTYSSGMFMRLAFSVATHVDPEILLVDEILAVGDEHFGRKSLAKMTEFKQAGKTIVLVTHDLTTLERWCDLAGWLDGGTLRMLGPPNEVVAAYREAVSIAEASSSEVLAASGGAPLAMPVRLHVELASLSERPTTALSPEDGLAIYVSAQGLAGDEPLALRLTRGDGVEVYSAGVPAELVRALARGATVSARLARTGLLRGFYFAGVRLADEAKGRVVPAQARFDVDADGLERGVVRPPLAWTVVAGEQEPRAARG